MKPDFKRASLFSILFGSAWALTALVGHAQVIDDFSTGNADHVNYTDFDTTTGTLEGFNVNSSEQFQPTLSSTTITTYFLRNTGQTLSDTIFNESVSLDLDDITGGGAGIGFSASLGSLSDSFEVGIIPGIGLYLDEAGAFSVLNAATENFSDGPILLTVTRTGATTFSYAASGADLTGGPLSGTFTDAATVGQNLYFGPEIYTGGYVSPTDPIITVDNLSFVPEPGVVAMMFGGLGLLVLVRRFRSSMP